MELIFVISGNNPIPHIGYGMKTDHAALPATKCPLAKSYKKSHEINGEPKDICKISKRFPLASIIRKQNLKQ